MQKFTKIEKKKHLHYNKYYFNFSLIVDSVSFSSYNFSKPLKKKFFFFSNDYSKLKIINNN